MTNKTLVVLLGVNGTLSSAIINDLASNHADEVDMIGFDVQPSTDLPVSQYHTCDLGSRKSIRAALAQIPYGEYKDIRLLMCAAVMNLTSLEGKSFSEAAFYKTMQIDLAGQGFFATTLARNCVKAGIKARIIAIGSTAAYIGSNDIAYSMSKAGLNGMVHSLSKYFASRGVVANAIHTGIFESAMEAQVSEARKAKTIAMTHIKRKGNLEEIRNFVQYHLLGAPDFFTGQCIDINGGQHT
jgi:NAD(P)-dependent dehydrogenase (short-subunit alcohol dehydrogenase family)